MSKGQKCLLFSFLLAQLTVAQPVLMIEDQTKTGFKLVVNGFTQNETALNKLNIQGIPIGEAELAILLSDGRSFQRKLPDLEKGFHYYVLYRDYKGNTRMRYRGLADDLNQSAIMLDYSEKKPWIDFQKEGLATLDTNSQFEEWQDQQELISNLDSSELVIITELPRKDSLQTALDDAAIASIPRQDDSLISFQEPKPDTLLSKAKIEAETPLNAFAQFKTEWNATNFEFDKLQIAMNFLEQHKVDEAKIIFMLIDLKYDQSRLNLMQAAIAKEPKLKNAKEALFACLDYDLSKEQAKSYFQE